MTHPLLLNPFHSKQDLAQQDLAQQDFAQQDFAQQDLAQQDLAQQDLAQKIERRVTRSTRSTPVCSNCHSDDIISHATAQWSNETQEWELANTFAQPAHCNRCNGPCEIVWLPLN
jgi:hypothetical protein